MQGDKQNQKITMSVIDRDAYETALALNRKSLEALKELAALRARVKELEEELRVGNHLTAKFTDECRELENKLTAAEKFEFSYLEFKGKYEVLGEKYNKLKSKLEEGDNGKG